MISNRRKRKAKSRKELLSNKLLTQSELKFHDDMEFITIINMNDK